MLFNSFEFLVFFPVVTAAYFLLPYRLRWPMLLAASCIFYMAFVPKYILILLLTITVDFGSALLIERTGPGRLRRLFLMLSLIVTVLILAFFKYFNFLNDNLAAVAGFFHWNYGIESLRIILPIGLSFHTFQSMSYVIEVYRGNQKAEQHFGIFALYVMFYPQLVAGPIERPLNLLHQFREQHDFEYGRVVDGLKRMVFGLFKKMVIADQLAPVVNRVFNHPHDYAGFPFLFASMCFAYQIYCDFSGYSDIALGSAQVMGFRLIENFDRPYSARSVPDFWRRWHISLTTWFRDYIYIPLGGNRVGKSRWYANLFCTFLISGLWHGANWNFVLWGGLNGLYLILSSWSAPFRAAAVRLTGIGRFPRFHHALQVAVTFLLICLSWIFFRANSMTDAVYILSHLFASTKGGFALNGSIVFFIVFMEYIQHQHQAGRIAHLFSGRPLLVRWSLYYALVMIVLIFGSYKEQQFIYFQF